MEDAAAAADAEEEVGPADAEPERQVGAAGKAGDDRRCRIEFDAQLLASRRIGPEQLATALRGMNAELPAGRIDLGPDRGVRAKAERQPVGQAVRVALGGADPGQPRELVLRR